MGNRKLVLRICKYRPSGVPMGFAGIIPWTSPGERLPETPAALKGNPLLPTPRKIIRMCSWLLGAS